MGDSFSSLEALLDTVVGSTWVNRETGDVFIVTLVSMDKNGIFMQGHNKYTERREETTLDELRHDFREATFAELEAAQYQTRV